MSKYPHIILFRHNNYSHIDNFIEENRSICECTITITNTIDDLQKLFNSNYHVLVTYGDNYI